MNLKEAVRERHAVRAYSPTPLSADLLDRLQAEVGACNEEGSLHLQLVRDNPAAFNSFSARYGHFEGVRSYLCCVGAKSDTLEQRIGYYGERIVLLARTLGIDSCWVAMTYSKRNAACVVRKRERLVCVITLGFGKTHGVEHRSKDRAECFSVPAGMQIPAWFNEGIDAAMFAPTAMNRQKFHISLLKDGTVCAQSTARGSMSKIDLGIVKYHFEVGAAPQIVHWNCTKNNK